MFTTCSHCHTRFKVSAKQLKAAGGEVRCGKCAQVFDAFLALEGRDHRPPLAEAPADEMPEMAVKIGSKTTPDLNVALAALVEPPIDAPELQPGLLNPEVPPIEDLFAGLPDEADDVKREKPLPAPLTPEIEPLPLLGAAPVKAPPEIDFTPAEDLPAPPPPKPRRSAHTAAWWSGIAVLAVLLLGQVVNADRASLSQNLVIGPSLQALYSALGAPPPAAQSVAAWDVSGINVTSDPDLPGALSITGSLANHGAVVQPWPMLRVVLTDRYGETLRARDFKPAEYLPGTQANVQLAAGDTSRFRLDIVDPGADAVGFTLSPCVEAAAGQICSVPERD